MELFEELCKQNEASPLPGPFQKDFNGVRKTAWPALSSSFPPRILPLTEQTEKPIDFLWENGILSNRVE